MPSEEMKYESFKQWDAVEETKHEDFYTMEYYSTRNRAKL